MDIIENMYKQICLCGEVHMVSTYTINYMTNLSNFTYLGAVRVWNEGLVQVDVEE